MAAMSNCVTPQQPPLKVIMQPPQLVRPAAPTPNEFKQLSNLDNQKEVRVQILPIIMFYSGRSKPKGLDPVSVIKEALSKALVPYYPLAGRLREKQGRKLVVECNGEGVLFVEADAPDLSLDELGESGLVTNVPCSHQLLYDAPHHIFKILDSPLLLFQVTRLRCGGFTLAFRMNHTLVDAAGVIQFLNTMAETACGKKLLSVYPVWERHLFCARDPPRITCSLPAYEHNDVDSSLVTITPKDDMVKQYFFFGPTEISTLRHWVPPHLKRCTTFEIISACLWRCHTIAIQPDPEELVRFTFTSNLRFKFKNLIPVGYYGNGFVLTMAITTANKLGESPLGYAVELIQKAKDQVTEEYMKSVIDLMEIKDRPSINLTRNFVVTDITQVGFILEHLEYGWGPPVHINPVLDVFDLEEFVLSTFYISSTNEKGEKGLMYPICLPSLTMERFHKEIQKMLNSVVSDEYT